jgi:hypothetical protein
MACDVNDLTIPPTCTQWVSRRKQRQMLAQLLCYIAANGVEPTEGVDCSDPSSLMVEGVVCLGEATNRQQQATIISAGIEGLDINLLNCYQDAEIEAMITRLVCLLLNAENPVVVE